MPLKVKKTTSTKKNLNSELDFLTGVEASASTKKRIKSEVGEFLVEQTLLAVGDAISPLTGKGFKSLEKKYKALKKSKGLGTKPNLEFQGDLLDSVSFQPTKNGIKIGHINSKEAPKADGHNNFSGKSSLPLRRYLPGKKDKYKKSISIEVDKIIADEIAKDVSVKKTELRQVNSRAELFDILSTQFLGMTRKQISSAVKRNPSLINDLDEFDLLGFLDG